MKTRTALVIGTLLAGYGAVRLAEDTYRRIYPAPQDTYELFIKYPQPDKEMADASMHPDSIFIRRDSDARILYEATFATTRGERKFCSQGTSRELSDRLGGTIQLRFIGEPRTK